MRALRELQIAARTVTRSLGFTTVVVLMLGLGIGASTAVFSVVNTVLLKPLDYPEPQQLVRITSELRGFGASDTGVGLAELLDYQARTDLFSGVAGIAPISANVTGSDTPVRVEMMLVSWNYFSVLGVAPTHGRVFQREDDVPGVGEIAVVSDRFWRRYLNADPSAIGKAIVIDADPIMVVGVMGPGFRHPGRTLHTDVDVWSPSGFRGSINVAPSRSRRNVEAALARLQAGVTLEQAQERLNEYGIRVSQELPSDYPPQNGWRPYATSLQDSVVGGVSTQMLTLLGGVCLLLLIACVNVAHLVLARASDRRREMAIRQALGARPAQLLRQLAAESALLGVAGGLVGLLVAAWLIRGVVGFAPARVPRIDSVTIDLTAILVTAATSFVATIVFGLVPAWQLRRVDMFAAVKDSGPARTDGRPGRARDLLVVAEVAMATVLLVGAGLLVRTLVGLVNVPLGFETESLLTARVALPRPNDVARATYLDPARRAAFVQETLRRVTALPGVEHAAMSNQIPMGGFNRPLFVEVEGFETGNQSAAPVMHRFQVSPSYFQTMQVRVRRGRGFVDADRAGSAPVAIVSESAARAYWNGRDPIGGRLRLAPQLPWMTVVGVAGDVLNRRFNEAPQPILYQPLDQSSDLSLALLVRTRGPVDVSQSIVREVRAVDPDLPVYSMSTMTDVIGSALAQRQFVMRLLAAFAAAATLLALFGIYGLMSYSVSKRTREIGIRMAIGARESDMSRMIVGRGVLLTAIGLAAGCVASLGLSRFVRSQLFGVEPSDPLTIAAVVVLMMAVAVIAAYVPARRAARVNPVIALRSL